MTFKTVHRWIRRIWITLGVGFMAFLAWSVQAHGVPAAAFDSDEGVRVAAAGYGRTFIPASPRADATSLIFLPGGLIDPDAYVPLVRRVAEAGIPVALVHVPLRAAPTSGMRATLWARIRAARSDLASSPDSPGPTRGVVVAGHSRGGMLAATFAADHSEQVDGLVLIGTTHPRDRDLSAMGWPVLKILGSADCVASVRDARANAARLPVSTEWLEIAGGNHRQFGYYGRQIGDCAATLSREDQHRQTAEAIVSFLTRAE